MKTSIKKLSTTASFGDKRLNTRFEKIAKKLSAGIEKPIPQALKNWADTKGAYRFFKNKKVEASKIIQAHFKSFESCYLEGSKKQRIFQLTDTVEFDYTPKKGADDLGCLNYEHRKGIWTHNSLLVSEVCSPIGLLKQTHAMRDIAYFGKSNERRYLPVEDKESYRWIQHFKRGNQLCIEHPNLEVVYVADREADFMELLTTPRHENMHFLLRSQYNRNLVDDELKLRERLAACPIEKQYRIQITDATNCKKRKVKVALRYCEVKTELVKKIAGRDKLPPVKLTAIEVKQVNPPQKGEPIHWILLTTLPVENALQAKTVVKYYTWRWLIERFHFLLKSGGAQVEELQLHTAHRLKNAISTYSIAVMNVFKLRYAAENQPNTSIYEFGITPVQHEVLYRWIHLNMNEKVRFEPDKIPSVEEFCILLGQLGGFFPSKRHPLPGLKILNRANSELKTMVDAFLIFMSMN
jgi:hypothetical protein